MHGDATPKRGSLRLTITLVACVLASWLAPSRSALAQAQIGAPIEVGDEPTSAKADAGSEEAAHSSRSDGGSHHRRRHHDRTEEAEEEESPDAGAEGADAGTPMEHAAIGSSAADAGVIGGEEPPIPTTPQVGGTTTEATASIVQAWQARLEWLAAGDQPKAKREEANILTIKSRFGLTNLLGPATALVREADELVQEGHAAEAADRCDVAASFAPDLNLVHLCRARVTLAQNPTAIGAAIGSVRDAFRVTMSDVRSRRNAITNAALTGLFGFALACGVLVLLLILRYASLSLHDFHHLFPNGVPVWQTTIVAVVLLVLPVLMGMGVFGSIALAAIAVAVTAGRAEAIALGVAFVLLAAAQFGGDRVMRTGAFGRLAQDVYLLERGDAPDSSAKRLWDRADHGLGDYATGWALGRYFRRMDKYDQALQAYEAAKKLNPTAELLNNIGAVQFLAGDMDGAKKSFRDAIQANSRLAAAHLNLSKIAFKETRVDDGERELALAREADPDFTANYIKDVQNGVLDDGKPIDLPLNDQAIAALADREARAVLPPGGATWSSLSGHLPETAVVIVALLTAVLIAVAQSYQRRLRPSSRCERCGRAVCVRCDPELGTTIGMCGQCITVFVRRTGVDAPVRIRKEIEVRRFRRRRRILQRAVGAVIGGGGHILGGHVIAGVIFLAAFSLLVAEVVFWDGVLHSPVPVQMTPSPILIGAYVAVFLFAAAISIWHLLRTEEND